jgi:hypothetical protein
MYRANRPTLTRMLRRALTRSPTHAPTLARARPQAVKTYKHADYRSGVNWSRACFSPDGQYATHGPLRAKCLATRCAANRSAACCAASRAASIGAPPRPAVRLTERRPAASGCPVAAGTLRGWATGLSSRAATAAPCSCGRRTLPRASRRCRDTSARCAPCHVTAAVPGRATARRAHGRALDVQCCCRMCVTACSWGLNGQVEPNTHACSITT